MKNQFFLLLLFFYIFNTNLIAISALQYASNSTKSELDTLIKKATNQSVSKEEITRVKTLYVSLRQTQPKTAIEIKDTITKSETLAKLFPDIAGQQKIISQKTGNPLTPQEKKEIVQKIDKKTDTIIVESKVVDPKTTKTELIALQAVTKPLDITENLNITQTIENKIEKNETIKTILDDPNIKINKDYLAKRENEIANDLEFDTQTERVNDIFTEIRNELYLKAIAGQNSQERFDAYKNLALLIEKYLNFGGNEAKLETIRTDFIKNIIDEIQDEFEQLEKRDLLSTAATKLVRKRCEILDDWIQGANDQANIAKLKTKINEQDTWVKEYDLYVFPIVNNLQKIKDIFNTQETITRIFGNVITNEQKKQLRNLIIVYILGAAEPTNLNVIQYNDKSIGGLLSRYITYINDIFIKNKAVKDFQDLEKIISINGIIGTLFRVQDSLFVQFYGIANLDMLRFYSLMGEKKLALGRSIIK